MTSLEVGRLKDSYEHRCPHDTCYGRNRVTVHKTRRGVTSIRIHPCNVCGREDIVATCAIEAVKRI